MERSPPRGIPASGILAVGACVLAFALGALWVLVPADATRGFDGEHVVELVGSGHVWHARYPGPDGRLGTADDVHRDGDLHVPAGVPTRIVLRSEDYIYALRVPSLAVNEVAVPDLPLDVRLAAAPVGSYVLEGGQMCGTPPAGLQGHVVVHEPAGYWAALRRSARP